jgi:GH25 family lysozyme M1 (1,4-beta-N-acetylmuramidase)
VVVSLVFVPVAVHPSSARAADGPENSPAVVPGAAPPAVVSPAAPTTVAQAVGSLAGIDVSHWQETIDWAQVAASGVSFVIAKATEGRSYVDPMYATNKAGATSMGLAFTAYHFARPDGTPGDAVAEADHFVDVAQLGPGNLIPALDVERTGDLSQTELTRWILDWLDRVTARLGVRPMVYTSPNGWKNRTGDTTAIADAGYTVLWVAHWDVSAPTVPAGNWGGHGWTFWQWTNCSAVPGIAGCVDADWYASSTFDAVTIPSPDATAPTATITLPAGLASPAVVAFSEAVRAVTPGNVVLSQPDASAIVPATLRCMSGRGTVVDCGIGPVWKVALEPQEPLVAAQSYSVILNPPGVTPAIVDKSGNGLVTVQQDFVAPTEAEEDSGGVVFSWRSMHSRRAYGHSYTVEHLGGARFTMAFPGRSITWYTATGPDQGRAAVRIDGKPKGVFDQYATHRDLKFARTFKRLRRGWHTIIVTALGTHAKAASDSQVVVDAFGVRHDVLANPTGTWTWRRDDVRGASGGRVAMTDVAHAQATFRFRGTGVEWYTAVGPNNGRAAMYVDGSLVRTVDNYAARAQGNVARSVTGLADGVHTLRIVVLGESRPKADASLVAVDRLVALP